MFQLFVVKVRVVGATEPSFKLLEETLTVTSAVGWVSRTSEKLAVSPSSVVCRLFVDTTLTPGVGAGMKTKETTASVAGGDCKPGTPVTWGKSRLWMRQPVPFGW